jgi:hypothetical protein
MNKNLIRNQLAAGEVITRRLANMWLAPHLAATQADMLRMVTEKQAAAVEAAATFSLSMANEAWKFWANAALGHVSTNPVERAVKTSLRKAAVPVNRRVRANRKRLSR